MAHKRRFKISGVGVGKTESSRREQALQHQKATRATMGTNIPRQAEGVVGDITVRKISTLGFRCYIKTDMGWIDINTLQSASLLQWHNMVLTTGSGWVTYSATSQVPQYCLDSNGFVHFRGVMKDGTDAQTAFVTLPPGFRPQHTIAVPAYYPGSTVSTGMRVTSAGVCNFVSVPTPTSTGQIYIDGISFHTRQAIVGSGGGSSSGGISFGAGISG